MMLRLMPWAYVGDIRLLVVSMIGSTCAEVVGVVVRQFGGNVELVDWSGDVVLQSTKYTKLVLIDDPGKICLQLVKIITT